MVWPAKQLGSEFMPNLNEGTSSAQFVTPAPCPKFVQRFL
jgi:Cu/Ag efflux pump CusA